MLLIKRKCTKEVAGTIVEVWQDRGRPNRVYVEFFANGFLYTISERVRFFYKTVKIGGFSVGRYKVPKIKDLKQGTAVHVKYNPENPCRSYIVENR